MNINICIYINIWTQPKGRILISKEYCEKVNKRDVNHYIRGKCKLISLIFSDKANYG